MSHLHRLQATLIITYNLLEVRSRVRIRDGKMHREDAHHLISHILEIIV